MLFLDVKENERSERVLNLQELIHYVFLSPFKECISEFWSIRFFFPHRNNDLEAEAFKEWKLMILSFFHS